MSQRLISSRSSTNPLLVFDELRYRLRLYQFASEGIPEAGHHDTIMQAPRSECGGQSSKIVPQERRTT